MNTVNLSISFISSDSQLKVLRSQIKIPTLKPKEKRIIEVPVQISSGIEDPVEVRVHVIFEANGIKSRTVHVTGHIPVKEIGSEIPTTQRYITSGPVQLERTDLFHGREKELTELSAAFADGRLLRLYFVNGIRAVGKSTLLIHLSTHCGDYVLPLILNLQNILNVPQMNANQFVRALIRESIKQINRSQNYNTLELKVPDSESFRLDPPWTVFDIFLDDLRQKTQSRNILLAFDEMQHVVKRIADSHDPLDDGFLAWLRSKIHEQSDIFIICTGSEPYPIMRRRYEHEHTVWRDIAPYNVSFVSKEAMEQIATKPVEKDGVFWLPESINRLWDMTEGHPWVTQILSESATKNLNQERRRIVSPGDIDHAAAIESSNRRISNLWWNEKVGLVTQTHRQIAFLILQHQNESRMGLPISQLSEMCRKSGIRSIARYLEEMKDLEILTEIENVEESQ